MIGYGSRTLASTEKLYHLSKLEHLALKWVVYDHFKPYVYYAKDCDVSTDNNPLLYSVSAAKLNTIDWRCASELSDYPITIHYKQGIQNKVADYLSRSRIKVTVQHQILSTGEVTAILSPVKNQEDNEEVWVAVLAVTKQPKADRKDIFSDRCEQHLQRSYTTNVAWGSSDKFSNQVKETKVEGYKKEAKCTASKCQENFTSLGEAEHHWQHSLRKKWGKLTFNTIIKSVQLDIWGIAQ